MKVPTSVAVMIIGATLLGVGAVVYQQIQAANDPSWAPAISDGRAFHTEEEWTALQIARTIADFGALSSGNPAHLQSASIQKRDSTDEAGAYEVRWLKKEASFSVAPGIWNPATYQPWAKAVLSQADPAPPPAPSEDVARALLDPGLKNLFAESEKLSKFLTDHPASAVGHAQAALLVGTVGLNDFSGDFRDLRIPLNRLTAHLAAADVLGVPASDPARLIAEGIRLTLSGQQKDALAAVASWPKNPALGEWSAILQLRNAGDWRAGRAAALGGSVALRNEYFRAITRAIDPTAGLEFLREGTGKPAAACWRIANETSLSVSNGHLFAKPILGIEFQEISEAARHFGIPVETDRLDWLKTYLDTPEGSPVVAGSEGLQIDVAGRNFFAGYHQRHFMQGGNKLFTFLNDKWGVRDNAKQTEDFLKDKVPDLRYKPFLLRMIARNDNARRKANTPCEAVISAHPEMVTPSLWASLRRDEDDKNILGAPDFHAWFRPEIPQGTAFDAEDRLYEIGVGDENNDAWLRTLWERAPYGYTIAMHNAYLENGRTYNNMSGEIAAKWLAPQLAFDVHAMNRVARCYAGQPDLYEKHMAAAADLDPDLYLTMGNYFVNRGLEEKAAEYYFKGFAKAQDRVFMASCAPWFVKYLVGKNDRATATKVAEEAAEVYSYSGLSAWQWLMENEGRWDKALETAVKSDERYNNGKPRCEIACLIRLNELSPEKAEAAGFREKLSKTFPTGLQKVTLADFTAAPVEGVRINESSPSLVPFGLAKDMVIVALNGYRTGTFDQYMAIRAISEDPKIAVIVWDGSTYRLSEGNLPDRKFGVEMVDYRR